MSFQSQNTTLSPDALGYRIVRMRRVSGKGRKVAEAVVETPEAHLWVDFVSEIPGSPAFVAPASISTSSGSFRRTWKMSEDFQAAIQADFEAFLECEP